MQEGVPAAGRKGAEGAPFRTVLDAASRPLSILALNWRDLRHPQAGGSEMNLFRQAREWVAAGHHVTLLTADYPGAADPAYRAETIRGVRIVPQIETMDGVEIVRAGGRLTVYLYVALAVLLRGRMFDCVLDVANGVPFFAPLVTRKPVALLVHHVHGRQWFTELPLPLAALGWVLERYVVPLVYRRCPVITVSPTSRDALLACGFREAQIQVVYNGVDAPFPHRSVQRQPHRIVYVGRLKRYKQIDRLICAAAALHGEFPDVHLDVVGDGDAREELAALAESLRFQEHVTFHGFVDDQTKATILSAASVFASPSMHEGWGLTVIEANTLGLPAIAYDVPGLRAAIEHGQTGLLAGNDEEFREALAALLRDGPRWESISAGARQWAARFSWEAAAKETLRVLCAGQVPHPGSAE